MPHSPCLYSYWLHEIIFIKVTEKWENIIFNVRFDSFLGGVLRETVIMQRSGYD